MFRSKLNLIFLTSIFLFSFFLFVILSQAKSVVDKNHVSARRAADYIHAVIQADRTIYSQYIVERLGETVSLKATENWKKEDSLLLPAQFLMMSSKLVNSKNLGVRFRLLSLWPINKNNGPKTSKEKTGLKKVVDNPDKPFIWTTHRNGTWKYNAIYPDKAVAKSCALCHNNHPRSPKKNFKRGDVMGGIHISFPVSKPSGTKSDLKFRVAPEVVADYVHAILDADRTVYAKHIVDRLQKKNIIYPSENWWEENTLLLPAQFLLNASDLIKNMRLGLDYKLISLWPINPHNGAANKFERTGLEAVASQPLRPYIGSMAVGNQSYFQAVYPDIAVAPACVTCHNAHPKSPKHDFKLYDVLGGIVISLPMGAD